MDSAAQAHSKVTPTDATAALTIELAAMRALHALSTLALESSDVLPVLKGALDAMIALQGADFGDADLYDPGTETPRVVVRRGVAAPSTTTGHRAVRSTPLLSASGERLGMLSMHFRTPRQFTAPELQVADLFARELARLVARARDEAARREREERRAFLLRLSDTLASLSDASAMTETASRLLGEHLHVDRTTHGELAMEIGSRIGVAGAQRSQDGSSAPDRSTRPREWTDAEMAMIHEVAERTRAAAERANAEGALRATEARFRRAQLLALEDVERLVVERTGERDALRRQLAEAEEAERRRLARELHDQLGQQLTALALGLEDAGRLIEVELAAHREVHLPLLRRLEQLKGLAREMTMGARYLALELRPPELDDMGFENALETYVNEWSARFDIAGDVVVAGDSPRALPPDVGSALYRIAQEALTNTAKHAAAKSVSVIVTKAEGEVRLIVEDDGRGFDVPAAVHRARRERRLGLAGIQERAALLAGSTRVESSPGKGTSVFVALPIPSSADAAQDTSGRSDAP